MSNAPLPSQLDVRKLAVKGVEISAETPVSNLPRIVDLLADRDGSIAVNLRFFIDEQRFKCIEGHIQGGVNMSCQRCLEPLPVQLDIRFQLGIVWSEKDAQRLPASLEPLIVGEELTDLADVVSEELILGLPYVSYHEADQCQQQVDYSTSAEDESESDEAVEQAKPNPFDVLASLKDK